ncbi:MAG: histidine phosphatase family protein [Saccharospirillum sp.]|nr:histidine phosphatase family protein [Saccharospirillum sp.]
MSTRILISLRCRWVLFVPLWLALATLAVAEEIVEQLPDTALIAAVSQGGYVLYFRHGKTDTATPDQVPVVLDDCTTQRPLTDAGRQELAHIAGYLARMGWDQNVEQLIASPFCRTQESARLLFPDHELLIDNLQMYTAALTAVERQPINERTRALLSQPVANGQNRVMVAHGPNIAEIMDYFPDEATLVIFQPTERGFRYLASIGADDWSTLIRSLLHSQDD